MYIVFKSDFPIPTRNQKFKDIQSESDSIFKLQLTNIDIGKKS